MLPSQPQPHPASPAQHRRRRRARLAALALGLPLAAALSGCSVVDTALGYPPTAAQRHAAGLGAGADLEPAMEVLPLPGIRDSAQAVWTGPRREGDPVVSVRSPRDPRRPASPAAPAPPVAELEPPVRWSPFDAAPAVERIDLAPPRSCPAWNHGTMMATTVTPAAGALRLTFTTRGTADLERYRIEAVSQTLRGGDQPPTVAVDLAPPAGCEETTVVVDGLEPGAVYRLVIVEETTSAATGRLVRRTVGASEAVSTL